MMIMDKEDLAVRERSVAGSRGAWFVENEQHICRTCRFHEERDCSRAR